MLRVGCGLGSVVVADDLSLFARWRTCFSAEAAGMVVVAEC